MAAENYPTTSLQFIRTFVILNKLLSTVGRSKDGINGMAKSLPPTLSSLSIASKLRIDPHALNVTTTDFGNIVREYPLAVFRPSSIEHISSFVKFIHNGKDDSSHLANLTIATRGHSIGGQAMAHEGIVVDMSELSTDENNYRSHTRAAVSWRKSLGKYVDVRGEMLWIDVLLETSKHGLTPVSWTDYLYLTVGATLSNSGISGTTFRYGPQISNVYEMDVITGTGEIVTCSTQRNRGLFYVVLGGLGQFGIITRARIALEPAPQRVIWVRLLYTDFSAFTCDQEHLITIHGRYDERALDYLEGSLSMHQGSPNSWRSSFCPASDHARIASLITKTGIIYCLEVAKYYDDSTKGFVDELMEDLLQGLSHVPRLIFQKDVSYVEFLNRVRDGEMKLRSRGSRDVPHPWMNLYVPKSRISDFDVGVFRNIIPKNNITSRPVLIHPTNKNEWDDRMSAVIPDEDVFYMLGFLQSSGPDDWQDFELQNKEVFRCCEEAKLEAKKYLPQYDVQEEWKKHFGSKWLNFERAKVKFDPKMILSNGQRIFN